MTTALIADDEPLLRLYLREKLSMAWPELVIVDEAENGNDASVKIAQVKPDVAFLDIKMPGQTGIEVAQGIETDTRVVFVTAYEQFAVRAFESGALDYLLKPVTDARLSQTVARLKASIAQQLPLPDMSQILNLLARAHGENGSATDRLRWIRANRGDTTYQIAVDEVLFFQSADKYTLVVTANGEHVISKTLSDLVQVLDAEHFWQIHRSTVVNARCVTSTKRDGEGRMTLHLKGFGKPLAVSRAYQPLFRQM